MNSILNQNFTHVKISDLKAGMTVKHFNELRVIREVTAPSTFNGSYAIPQVVVRYEGCDWGNNWPTTQLDETMEVLDTSCDNHKATCQAVGHQRSHTKLFGRTEAVVARTHEYTDSGLNITDYAACPTCGVTCRSHDDGERAWLSCDSFTCALSEVAIA